MRRVRIVLENGMKEFTEFLNLKIHGSLKRQLKRKI